MFATSIHRWGPGSLALVTAVLLSLLAGTMGCGKAGQSRAGAEENVYRFAVTSDIKGYDPIDANDVPTARILGAIYDTLLQYSYLERPYRVVPDLAASMPEVSEDGLTYVFHLQEGVRFHADPAFGRLPAQEGEEPRPATRELVAEDFVYAWKRLAHSDNHARGWWVLDGWVKGLNEWREEGGGYDQPVEGLRAPDPHTLVVELTRPYPQFLWVLTMVYTAPVAREVVEHYGDEFLNHAVGTGAFMVEDHVRNSRLELVKNPDYREDHYPSVGCDWAKEHGLLEDAGKQLPFLDRIVYEVIPESQPGWLKFMRGQLDRYGIPKDSFDSVMRSREALGPELEQKGMRLQISPSQTMWWIGFNVADPVFAGEKGLHLRRAIAYSHDAEKFVRVIYNDRGQLVRSIIPPMLPAHDESKIEWDYGYDLEKAARELELAGYPGGEGAPRLVVDTRGQSSLSRQICEFLIKDMEAIGLEAEIRTNNFQQFLKRARQGQTQVYWGGWVGDYPDEENWLQLLYGPNASGGTNYSNYSDPEFDRLYEETRVMVDSPERRELIQEAVNIALRDCPWRMSFVATDYVLSHRWLENFMYGDGIYNWQKYFRIDTADRARGF